MALRGRLPFLVLVFMPLVPPTDAGPLVKAAEIMGFLDKKPPRNDLDSSFRALLDMPDSNGDRSSKYQTSLQSRRRLLGLGLAWACAVELIVGLFDSSDHTIDAHLSASPSNERPKKHQRRASSDARDASSIREDPSTARAMSSTPPTGHILHAQVSAPRAAEDAVKQYPCTVDQVRTPCYAVDLRIAKANADRMQATASKLGVSLRPHVKTHKTVEVALLQTGGQRSGICASSIAEVDFFASRGFKDILYACPLTPDKVPMCARLADQLDGSLIVCVDSDAQLDAILAHPPIGWPKAHSDDPFALSSGDVGSGSHPASRKFQSREVRGCGRPWRVVLMVDCGYRREGLDPFVAEERLKLARLAAKVAGCEWTKLHGVYTHGGHAYDPPPISHVDDISLSPEAWVQHVAAAERDACAEAAKVVRDALRLRSNSGTSGGDSNGMLGGGPSHHQGVSAAADAERLSVSIGSTPTCCLPPSDGYRNVGVTEMHPGNYAFFDAAQVALGACRADDVAVRILTRVVGHYPKSNTLQVDMGWTAQGGGQGKTLHYGAFTHTAWSPKPRGSASSGGGHENGDPAAGLQLQGMSQEMGEVSTADGSPIDFEAFPVGTVLAFVPYHSCAAGHCHPSLLVLEDGLVLRELEVAKGW